MSGFQILMVDDDPSIHELLTEHLRDSGYTLHHAHDGEEGLALFRELEPDLVLLDVQMPGLSGLQVLEAVKQDPLLEDIPVLLVTSLNKPYFKVAGLELGADDYVVKPFDPIELTARIAVALRRSERFKTSSSLLEGKLPDIALVDVLQTLELGNKSMTIQLVDLAGAISVSGGRIVDAKFRTFSATPAVTRLLFLERGRFTVGEIDPEIPTDDDEAAPVSTVLMFAVTAVDEARRALSAVPTDSCRWQVSPDSDVAKALSEIDSLGSCSIFDVVATMPGNIVENATAAGLAYIAGELFPEA